jgi:hypothetical protein
MRLHMCLASRLVLAPAAALLLAVAAACARDDTATVDTSRVAGGTVDTGIAATLRVTEVELGKALDADGSVRDDTDDFGVNDTIYVAVRTSGTASNARLSARWTYQDGQVVSEDARTISARGDAWTEFHVSKPGGWPKGTYRVAILLDGREVETEEFEID